MATREDNIKKINDELEKLSDDELDKVAGGSMYETSLDASFLYGLNGSCGLYSAEQVLGGKHDAEIAAAWKSVGILAFINSGGYERCPYDVSYVSVPGSANFYAIMDEETGAPVRFVHQFEAMQYAVNYVKTHS